MPSEAEDVNVHFLHVDWYYPGTLRCVDNQKRSVRVCNFGDAGNIENVSGQIGCVRADDGLRVLPKQRFKILVPDISQPVCGTKSTKTPRVCRS